MARTVARAPRKTAASPAMGTAVALARGTHGARLARVDTRRLGLALVAAGMLALAVAFHSARLTQSPGWDPQEGYNLDLAWNLLHGRLRLFALTQDFAQHPPLFYLQLAVLIHVFGYGMAAIRALVAAYAVATCGAILVCGRRLVGIGPALWAGLVFSAAPIVLANTRWGYSYAALMPLVIACIWALDHYAETRERGWLLLAASLAGVAMLSDYEGVALVALVGLGAVWIRGRDAIPALGIALGVPVVGLLACFAAAPAVFAADAGDTFGRAAGGNLALQLVELLVNYYRFITLDPWLVLGVVGLLLVRDQRRRSLLLMAAGVLGLVVLKVRAVDLSFHTAVPLLPLVALGAGVALDAAVRHLYSWAAEREIHKEDTEGQREKRETTERTESTEEGEERRGTAVGARESPHPQPLSQGGEGSQTTSPQVPAGVPRTPLRRGSGSREGGRAAWWQTGSARRARNLAAAAMVFVVVVSPLAIALAEDGFGMATILTTREDGFVGTPGDAQAVARYVLAHERPGDVTLGSPQVVWMLDQPDDARGQPRTVYGADILQALAYDGQAAAFYPAGLARARWAFDVSTDHARYVIVDNLVRALAAPGQVDSLPALLRTVEGWPVVYRRGQYAVYARPVATTRATATTPGTPPAGE